MRLAAIFQAVAVLAGGVQISALRGGDVGEQCDPSKWKLPVDGQYNTGTTIDAKKLNVHLIPHTHDDPGWIINVDEYYMQRVQYILDTVVEELQLNPDRKFMYVEQSFFQRWWNEQSAHTKAIVKDLVHEGRLDLTVNGGWVMHDEATCHYTAMVDQTAYGHQLLREEFNITPRIGWQIDPFGHSATQGSLLSSGVGFDALYFARIDYEDYKKRKANRDLEFIWRPSKSRGKAAQVFTGVMLDHYSAPEHFRFEGDPPIQDNPSLHDFNVCSEVDTFVRESLERGKWTKGNHIFLPMGMDFSYINARKWFKNMDKLIHYTNQDGRINVLYSNLSYYTDLKKAEGLTWSVKTDDFFPYASADHAYWSGFFTSRPALKKFARLSNVLLQQMRQINAIYESNRTADLDALARAVALVQHHDGITGTEKQAVADDYAQRLHEGVTAAEKGLNEILFDTGEEQPYRLCLQSNASICETSTQNEEFEILVHNALPRTALQTISVPVSSQAAKVEPLGDCAPTRQQHVTPSVPVHPDKHDEAPYMLHFSTELKPLQTCRFTVNQHSGTPWTKGFHSGDISPPSTTMALVASSVVLENSKIRAEVNKATGSLMSITNKEKRISIPINSSLGYYVGYKGKGQQSGAYIFRPESSTIHAIAAVDEIQLLYAKKSSAVSEGFDSCAFKLGTWGAVAYKVRDSDDFVEMEWTVGSIPIDDHKGKEVVVRFDTNGAIQSRDSWYTDSNGMEFVERRRNHRDTWNITLHDEQDFVAANYGPITAGAFIRDDNKQLSIVTDRAQGVGSLKEGQMEVMLHRRLLADDTKGVHEALNETETFVDPVKKNSISSGLKVRGSLLIGVNDAKTAMASLRSRMEKQFFAPLVAFRKTAKKYELLNAKSPWLEVAEFPSNVGLTTLIEMANKCIMVRIHHLFAVNEHSELSKPVHMDFNKYFSTKDSALTDVSELSLTGVLPIGPSLRNMDWQTDEDGDSWEDMAKRPLKGSIVELQPMELRTFKLCFGNAATDEPSTSSAQISSAVMAIE